MVRKKRQAENKAVKAYNAHKARSVEGTINEVFDYIILNNYLISHASVDC
jgi:hypothetical protein